MTLIRQQALMTLTNRSSDDTDKATTSDDADKATSVLMTLTRQSSSDDTDKSRL